MKRIIALIVLAIGINNSDLKAQQYKTGIGIRVGYDNGFNIKHFIADRNALEGIVSFYHDGLSITGLYELQNNKAFKVDHLDWFYGFGGHIGFWDDNHNSSDNGDHQNQTVIGIDGIIGLEYTFTEVPINLGADFKPVINLIGDTDFYPDFAISVRYVFK